MRRLAGPALLLLCAPLLVGFRWPWETSRLQKEARAAFEQQDYARADELWSELYRDRPGDAALAYNLGTARLARGEYAGAMEVLGQGLERTRDPALLDQLHYNRGNAAFKMGDLERAAADYEAALRAVPGDEDAAYNLELCRQQPPPPQGGGGSDPDEDQTPPPPPSGGAGTGDSTAPRQAGGISEAEADRKLEQLKEDEENYRTYFNQRPSINPTGSDPLGLGERLDAAARSLRGEPRERDW